MKTSFAKIIHTGFNLLGERMTKIDLYSFLEGSKI